MTNGDTGQPDKAAPGPAHKVRQTALADVHSRELTPTERTAAQRLQDRRAARPPAPRFKITGSKGRVTVEPVHPEPVIGLALLADTFCTGDVQFAEGLLRQLATIARTGKDLTAGELNTMVATVHAIAPRDPTEALLAAQMAAIHKAMMEAASRLAHAETIGQQEMCTGMLVKLARTFSGQVEALKRYRSSGEQSVTVTHQHVSVTADQAVIGIHQGGGGTHENASQPHEPCRADEPSPPLLGEKQAVGLPMPGAGRAELDRLPIPRRPRRRTEGQG